MVVSYDIVTLQNENIKLQEENERLKNILKNIKHYLIDKTCSLIKIIKTAGDNRKVVSDLIAKEEAYSDILKYIEGKGY